MKYSVFCKFLAILLCAAMLFGALGSGLAILALNEAGLYRESWQDAYNRYRGDVLQQAADSIVVRYAAMEQGGFTRRMTDQYFGTEWQLQRFAFGKMGYTLLDGEGNVLQTYNSELSGGPWETIRVIPSVEEYPSVEATYTADEYRVAQGLPGTSGGSSYITNQGSTTVYDAVPTEGAVVTSLTADYGDSSEGVSSPDGLGRIFHNDRGYVEFHAEMSQLLDVSLRSKLVSIRFENEELGLLYHISDPEGVGLLYTGEDGFTIFLSDTSNPAFGGEPEDPTPTENRSPVSVGAQIYSAPSLSSNGYPAVPVGTVTEEDLSLTWQEVSVNGELWYVSEKGWVCAAREELPEITDNAPEEGMGDINQMLLHRETPVYAVPNGAGEPIGSLAAGTEIDILRTEMVGAETWMLTREGWIRSGETEAKAQSAPMETVSAEPELDTLPDTLEEAMTRPEPLPEATEETAEETPLPVNDTAVPSATDTDPATQTAEATEASQPWEETIPAVTESAASARETSLTLAPGQMPMEYYDPETNTDMVAIYTLEQTPEYTVEFRLAQGALSEDHFWWLLGIANTFRNWLLPVLLGSVLLFAVLAVYLCCAAGRRPGVPEVKAGGLNRLPLDGWLVLWLTGLVGASLLGIEGGEYLMRGSTAVGTAFVAALAYGCCLLTVCFCFACAAQFKTPGGFWWRNTLCGHGWKIAVLLCTWTIDKGIRVLRWLYRFSLRRLVPMAKRLCVALQKYLLVLWVLLRRWVRRVLKWLLRFCRWTTEKLERFIALLPMTWQWLLAGFGIIILLSLTLNTRIAIWGILLSLSLVLYGTHAFGILLEGVKQMNKGNLEEKVEDKLLIGSFRDFAGELNGLADVAVVAAQKQLKSERMKTELITNVSHDIKTPLTSIINYVDLLEKPHTADQQEAYLEVLNRQSQRLKKLVDDLMEMSKASTGNMTVDIITMDAAEAVNQALGEFADKLEKAQLIPVFRKPEEQVLMLADGRLVWRVLSNLLGNAVKYALPGTRIYLDLNRVGDDVVLSMKNISREELNVSAEELLERFVRGDVSRNTEGSGLGLNIARSLMELQKGKMQLLVDGDLFKVTLIFPAA